MVLAPPFPDDPSAATRHLCAGAYLDEDFRDTALREVYHRPGRAVALSHGFSLTPVLAHCLRARDASLIRDVAVTALVLGTLLVAPVAVLYAATVAVVFHAVVTRTPKSLIVATLVAAAFAAVVSTLPQALDVSGLLLLLALLVCAAAWCLWRQTQLDQFRPGRTTASLAQNQRLREIDLLQYGNTAVHAGHNPFVGAGRVVDTWGLAQPLGTDPPFDAAELVAHLQWHLGALVGGPGTRTDQTIAGMTVTDRVHLAGTEVGNLDPITPPGLVADIIRRPTSPARHHLACQVASWGGEVVTTVHIHAAVQAGALYLELTTTALLPCPAGYRIVDLPEGAGLRSWFRALGDAVLLVPGMTVRAPVNLVRALVDTGFPDKRPFTRERGLRLGLDHGARVAVREIPVVEVDASIYPDISKHRRLIERRVMDAVVGFLEVKGADSAVCRAGVAARIAMPA
ncbi:hypothetical protein AB0M02_29430 [Actinoplanes sp. NPDC051861]|uniref:hypothetical protein n=1 Tax=Actinoplanes sp. NPDC051861 TaxID=3155170 RepID=UPI003444DED2